LVFFQGIRDGLGDNADSPHTSRLAWGAARLPPGANSRPGDVAAAMPIDWKCPSVETRNRPLADQSYQTYPDRPPVDHPGLK